MVKIVNTTNLLPFMVAIMETPMRLVPSVLEKCDGSTNPDEHLRMFVN